VCGAESLLTTLTVSPGFTVSGEPKLKLAIVIVAADAAGAAAAAVVVADLGAVVEDEDFELLEHPVARAPASRTAAMPEARPIRVVMTNDTTQPSVRFKRLYANDHRTQGCYLLQLTRITGRCCEIRGSVCG
jgi:hypothetical protein